jgi:hypothetical protein
MGRELGRISGPLLADNLKRNGTDLAFENSLLYLNVTTSRIGINSMGPSSDLTIGTSLANGGTGTGTLNTTTLSSAGTTNIGNFTITSNTIQHLTGGITISPNPASNPTTVVPALSTANLYFRANTLSNTSTNDNINFAAVGTGQIKLNSNVLVSGTLHATGNITFDGNITLGDSVNDRITFVAEVASDILPVAVLNAIAPAAQQLISQSGKLFAGIDDETLLFIAPKNTIITPVSEPFTTQDGQVLYAQDGSILYNNQAAPYIGSSYLYNLGSPSLNWGTVYSNTVASKTSITAGTLTVTRMNSGNIHIEGTTIANNYPGDSLYFSTSGTGYVSFNGNNLIVGNNINVPTSTNSLIINSTGTGYVKFAGTNGFVTPVGNTSNRPSSPQQGQMRFNTSIGEEEIYDVNAGGWIPIYGPTATIISEADMSDNSILYAIIFGR